MLRPVILNAIQGALTHDGFFATDDFSIQEEKSGHSIRYRHRAEFSLAFRLPAEPKREEYGARKHPIYLAVAPGDVNFRESFSVEGLDEFIAELIRWAERIRKDLEAEPIARAVAAHRERVEQLIADLKDVDADALFTQSEIDGIKEKLKRMEDDLADQIREHATSEKELKSSLERLHQQMAALTSQLQVLSKQSWFRTAFSRMLDWGAKKENRELLLEAAKTTGKFLKDIHTNGGAG